MKMHSACLFCLAGKLDAGFGCFRKSRGTTTDTYVSYLNKHYFLSIYIESILHYMLLYCKYNKQALLTTLIIQYFDKNKSSYVSSDFLSIEIFCQVDIFTSPLLLRISELSLPTIARLPGDAEKHDEHQRAETGIRVWLRREPVTKAYCIKLLPVSVK